MPDLVASCPVTLSFQIWDALSILSPSPFPYLVRFFGSVVLQHTYCMSGAILLLERQLSAPEAYSSLRKVDRNHLGQVKILAVHTPRKGLEWEVAQPCVCQECTGAAYHAVRREPDGEKAHAASAFCFAPLITVHRVFPAGLQAELSVYPEIKWMVYYTSFPSLREKPSMLRQSLPNVPVLSCSLLRIPIKHLEGFFFIFQVNLSIGYYYTACLFVETVSLFSFPSNAFSQNARPLLPKISAR